MAKVHGYWKSRTWCSWNAMKQRCLNRRSPKFKDYGGRGISICDEWIDFQNFYKDMGERPPGKSLGRIDNDGNYCKENCRWETPKEQAQNRRPRKLRYAA